MRRIVQLLLLLFVFAIPWEYSLDLGAGVGYPARVAGLLVLACALPTLLLERRLRKPDLLIAAVGAALLWMCATYLWSIEPPVTAGKLLGYVQELMVAWLVWEFADRETLLKAIMTAYVAGGMVLALLTVRQFGALDPASLAQLRFYPEGHDPNDAARTLALGLPMAGFLADRASSSFWRWFSAAYLLVGFTAIVLTASRSGFVSAAIGVLGVAWMMGRNHRKRVGFAIAGLLVVGALYLALIPKGTLERIASIVVELRTGDINDRANIWQAGWDVVQEYPVQGSGAGCFAIAARLDPGYTAHNTPLAILVEGGFVGLALAGLLAALAFQRAWAVPGALGVVCTTLAVLWLVASATATVEESRSTWLLFGLFASAARLAREGALTKSAEAPLPAKPLWLRRLMAVLPVAG